MGWAHREFFGVSARLSLLFPSPPARAAPPLLVVRHPMRLWVRETASPPRQRSRLQTQTRPAPGPGRYASRRAELPLPAGSACAPGAQAHRRASRWGLESNTTRAREGRKEGRSGSDRFLWPFKWLNNDGNGSKIISDHSTEAVEDYFFISPSSSVVFRKKQNK